MSTRVAVLSVGGVGVRDASVCGVVGKRGGDGGMDGTATASFCSRAQGEDCRCAVLNRMIRSSASHNAEES